MSHSVSFLPLSTMGRRLKKESHMVEDRVQGVGHQKGFLVPILKLASYRNKASLGLRVPIYEIRP